MRAVLWPGLLAIFLVTGCHLVIDDSRHIGGGDGGADAGFDAGHPDAAPRDSGPRDAGGPTDAGGEPDSGPVVCGSDLHCSDGMFCNGMERCDPSDPAAGSDGCVAGEEPDCDDGVDCTVDGCSDVAGECTHEAPDRDGDGAGDAECLGAGGEPAGDDCDDGDGTIHPGATEACNGADDDCDDAVDEGADASTCAAVSFATVTCGVGCEIASCDAGHRDCDGTYGNGCEQDIASSAANCGACDYTCDDGLCHDGACSLLGSVVAPAANYVCVLRPDGAVWCWGEGYGTTRGDLEAVTLPAGAMALSSQLHNTCAVLSDGTARCWGRTELSGTTAYFPDTPAAPGSLSDATSVGVGLLHACAVRTGGTVACWGNGEGLALGPGYDGTDDLATAVDIAGVADVVQIETGWRNDCVRTSAGAVRCWGTMSPSLGDGSTTSSGTPVDVTLPAAATDIDVTRNHGCAVTTAGEVWCWGRNAEGQLGDGTTTDRLSPVRAHAYTDAVDVAVAENLTCVKRSTGAVECWGTNGGRFGDGTYTSSATPVAVDTTLAIDTMALSLVGAYAIDSEGAVLSWGSTDSWLMRRSSLLLRPGRVEGSGR